jgi:hypothetical protein
LSLKYFFNTTTLNDSIIFQLDKVANWKLIEVNNILNSKTNYWDSLPNTIKENIAKGEHQIKNGEGISHQGVCKWRKNG